MTKRASKFKLVFFSVIICPEFAILLLIPLGCFVPDSYILKLISNLKIDPNALKYISLIPVGILGLTLKDFKHILQPDHQAKIKLLQWPGYWSLKVGYFGALIYQVIFALIGLSVWLIYIDRLSVYFVVALVISIIGSAVSYWTLLLVKAKIQEILS